MKVNVICQRCREEALNRGTWVADIYMAPLTDDGVYKFTCRLGHENAVAWQAFKFEYLFEMAIHAIADGYNREAVASATASLERFYEFFYRAVSRKDGVPDEEVDRVWKRMRKQSERQLGTFMSLHLSRFKMAPDLLAENHKESKWEPRSYLKRHWYSVLRHGSLGPWI